MITRVKLRNWKSHHESEFTFSSGVNALVGEMGSGKSSVLEAISFALYGKTPALQSRKVTLDDVIRRSPSPAEEAAVEVEFERDDTTYTVRREVVRGKGTDHSELRQDGELIEAPQTSEVTEEVEDLLGIDFDLFSRAIYSEQNELDAFLTMAPGDRKEKVDELLQLDRFETARGNLVTLTNRVTDRRQQKQETLDRLEEDIDEGEIAEAKEDIDTLEDELASLQEEMAEKQDALADAREERDELAEKQDQYQEMNQRETALTTRIESLEEERDELVSEAGDCAGMSAGEIADRRGELADELAELEELDEERDDLEHRLDNLTDRRERLQDRRDELEQRLEELEALDEVEEELEAARNELETVKEQIQQHRARIEDIDASIDELSTAADTCPTCGQDLTEDHRVDILQDRKAEREELQAEIDDLTDRREDLADRVDDLSQQRDDLMQFRGAADELDEVEDEIEEVEDGIETVGERLDEVETAYDPDRVEEIEAAQEQLDAAEELVDVREELEERKEELAGLREERDDLDFDEEGLENARERVNELEKRRDVLQERIGSKEKMLEEREERLAELEERRERLDDLEDEIGAYRRKEEFLHELGDALEATQVELRERFVDRVNQVMEQVWARVYPYDDYQTVRLNAAEGYAVEVQDSEGSWVSVEGEVSGGERHTAALALRIALAITLAPTWRILMLDEPTHNLDVTAIEDLAETLRTKVSEIVDQLFLITHEERLEVAVTGELYNLSKQASRNGLTQVERATDELEA